MGPGSIQAHPHQHASLAGELTTGEGIKPTAESGNSRLPTAQTTSRFFHKPSVSLFQRTWLRREKQDYTNASPQDLLDEIQPGAKTSKAAIKALKEHFKQCSFQGDSAAGEVLELNNAFRHFANLWQLPSDAHRPGLRFLLRYLDPRHTTADNIQHYYPGIGGMGPHPSMHTMLTNKSERALVQADALNQLLNGLLNPEGGKPLSWKEAEWVFRLTLSNIRASAPLALAQKLRLLTQLIPLVSKVSNGDTRSQFRSALVSATMEQVRQYGQLDQQWRYYTQLHRHHETYTRTNNPDAITSAGTVEPLPGTPDTRNLRTERDAAHGALKALWQVCSAPANAKLLTKFSNEELNEFRTTIADN
jgi:hypothetical protein